MNDDIIRMAREAGCGWSHNGTEPSLTGEKMLARFAALVAAAQKEKDAQICDAYGMPDGTSETARILAEAIRRQK